MGWSGHFAEISFHLLTLPWDWGSQIFLRSGTVSFSTQLFFGFTITVKVKFTNSVDADLSFEKSFSRYEDYDSNLDLSSVEKQLSDKIIELIVEDIFNQAFVNW